MNIGKAGTSLRRRLTQYRKFGDGTGKNHKGGRANWQLVEGHQLLVAWLPVDRAREVERHLIRAFKTDHDGRRPFGNRQD